jgi:hypothetical protein
MKITDDLDCERLQDYLSSINDWALVNNMQFNGTKFKVMRSSVSTEIGMSHCYLASDGTEIEKQLVQDLGVLMSTEATFDVHIEEIVVRSQQWMGWIWWTFQTREAAPMITLSRAFVLPTLEYCCQLWSPLEVVAVQK